jgi:hypothetical protein
MSLRLTELEVAASEFNAIPFSNGSMRESRASPVTDVNPRACALGKLTMTRNEICMKVRFDDVLDTYALPRRRFHVDIDIALRIDDRSHTAGCNKVRRVSETAEIKTLNLYGLHIEERV